MPQSINLYSPALCQYRRSDALGRVLQLQALLVAAGLALGAGLQWHGHQMRLQARDLAVRTEERRSGLTQVAATRPDQQPLRLQLQRLRDREAATRRLQDLLDSGSAGRRAGYSADLEALARRAHAAVWITGLQLQGSDDTIEIRGRMTDPAVLPEYLRHLQAEPRFRGRTFSTLQIRRGGVEDDAARGLDDAPSPGYSEFRLSSQPSSQPLNPAAATTALPLRQP